VTPEESGLVEAACGRVWDGDPTLAGGLEELLCGEASDLVLAQALVQHHQWPHFSIGIGVFNEVAQFPENHFAYLVLDFFVTSTHRLLLEDAGFRITCSCVDQQVTRECYAVRPAGASGTGDGQAFGDGFVTVLKFLVLEGLRIAWHREEASQGKARADNNPQK
jgi:hypothetical protein